MAADLCISDDVATALLRPLTDAEEPFVDKLITKASGLLRQAAPSIDARMGRYTGPGGDPTAVDPAVVATVVAGAVKRYMTNPEGLAAQAAGPFSATYALRSERETRGVLTITTEDLATLFPNRKRLRAGTIRTRPGLAPRPVGRYGPIPTSGAAVVSTVIDWSAEMPIDGPEMVQFLPGFPDGSTS